MRLGEGAFKPEVEVNELSVLGRVCCCLQEECLGSRAAVFEKWECLGCGCRGQRLFSVMVGDVFVLAVAKS